ncbi:MAG: hypothetical protein IT236_18260 [Bacteroidia bacterium]|nr:hypothetical protein [Bacteroidia bacterium]
MRYYKAEVPRKMEPLSGTGAYYMAGCNSTEYGVWDAEKSKKEFPLLQKKFKDNETRQAFEGLRDYWTTSTNYESGLAPLYYSAAALWVKIAAITGMFDSNPCLLPYWVRLLNVFFAVILVLLSYHAVRLLYPTQRVMRFAVPMFVAIVPQDTFYSIQNDVLSPVLYGLTFIAVMDFIKQDLPDRRACLFLGLSLAGTILVKSTNLHYLILILIFVLIKVWHLNKNSTLLPALKNLGWLFASVAIPVGLWFLWNLSTHGDLTASEAKIRHFHWTTKPFSQLLNTNFLTIHGICHFWTEIMITFWRGELVWNSRSLAMGGMDLFYWASSLLFFLSAVFGYFKLYNKNEKLLTAIAIWSFLSALLFIVLLSLNFDFRGSVYPCWENPYFISGRLISAALIPFIILYLKGFDNLLSLFTSERFRIILLILIALSITTSEIIINKNVFGSNFNLFSLIQSN